MAYTSIRYNQDKVILKNDNRFNLQDGIASIYIGSVLKMKANN